MIDEDFLATNVDKDGLRKLYRTDSTAKAVFDHLAGRQNNKRETPVDRLMQNISSEGFEISRPALTTVLKALERTRCGEYVVGRKGHPSRFRWNVGMVAAANYAAGKATVIETVDQATSDDEDDSATNGSHRDLVNGGTPQVTHRFQLRPDLRLSITLPSDLTTAEATRLADFVKTLPF